MNFLTSKKNKLDTADLGLNSTAFSSKREVINETRKFKSSTNGPSHNLN